VVENGGLRRADRARVVVDRDCVEHMGKDVRLQASSLLLDEPEPQVDVAEELPLSRGKEKGAAVELADTPHVVEERRGEQDVASQPRVELGRLAAQRGDGHGVLDEPTGV
jgi:hypothetical protein